jgi:DNA-binding transcriptional MerR regulator
MDKTYTIQELSELTGFSRRTIRYYIAEGLLEPPAGRGRGGFYYDSHLERLRQVRAWQEQGLGLGVITAMLKGETVSLPALSPQREAWSRYSVMPGLEINIRCDIEAAFPHLVSELVRLARELFKEGQL